MKQKIDYKNFHFIIIFIILFILLVCLLHYWNKQPVLYYYNNMEFKEYYATSPYADVRFKANDHVMYITVKYKKLKGASAIHIHLNNNGTPGPVLAWLGTSKEWQRGVVQTTVNGNSPCCTKDNINCAMASPDNIGTPYLNEINENSDKTFVVYNESVSPGKCAWIKNGTMLDIHGFNFQQKINGKLTNAKPGADIIYQSNFINVK